MGERPLKEGVVREARRPRGPESWSPEVLGPATNHIFASRVPPPSLMSCFYSQMFLDVCPYSHPPAAYTLNWKKDKGFDLAMGQLPESCPQDILEVNKEAEGV